MPGFGSVGIWEVILILAVLLLVFGAKRLPEIGAALGKGIREFKGSVREIENEINRPGDRNRGELPRQEAPRPGPPTEAPSTEAHRSEAPRTEQAPPPPPREVESTRPETEGERE
jgi:sec-independent protein translocase protein TatA